MIVTDVHQAIELSTVVVLDTIDRVNMYIPKLARLVEYNYYTQTHYEFLASDGDLNCAARYYAVLQSFSNDFMFSLPQASKEAIEIFNCNGAVRDALEANRGKLSHEELVHHLFIVNGDMNPYLMFMRGHLSATTVVNCAVVNLVLSLAEQLLKGHTHLADTYNLCVVEILNLK